MFIHAQYIEAWQNGCHFDGILKSIFVERECLNFISIFNEICPSVELIVGIGNNYTYHPKTKAMNMTIYKLSYVPTYSHFLIQIIWMYA